MSSSDAYSIHYDMQTNTFYKINKQTGSAIRSFLNGAEPPAFQPNVTGFDGRHRKTKERTTLNFRVLHRKNNSHHSSLVYKSIDTKLEKSKQRNKSPLESFLKTKIKIRQSSPVPEEADAKLFATETSPRQLGQDPSKSGGNFDKLAREYEQIKARKFNQNNSPFKTLEGSRPQPDMLKTICVLREDINRSLQMEKQEMGTVDSGSKSRHIISRRARSKGLPEILGVYEQIKKQRMQEGRVLGDAMDEKKLQRQKFRRQNLKKLEKLMLGVNSKNQRQVFSSSTIV